MAEDVQVQMDYSGIGKLLLTPEMHALVDGVAEAAIPFAKAISPDAAPYGVGFISSFEVDGGHEEKVTVRGGKRAVAYLANTSDHALPVEFGTANQNGHHVLKATADYIESL